MVVIRSSISILVISDSRSALIVLFRAADTFLMVLQDSSSVILMTLSNFLSVLHRFWVISQTRRLPIYSWFLLTQKYSVFIALANSSQVKKSALLFILELKSLLRQEASLNIVMFCMRYCEIIIQTFIIQMRQNSLAMRLNSMESRPMSKFKKSKNGLLAERRLEQNTPKNQESNDPKLRQNNNKDNAPSDRNSDKIKLITKLINKFSKKEERAIYQQLIKHFETEQSYRNHLTNSEITKDRILQATLKDIMSKIIRKQQELVENWTPASGNGESAQSNKCLIAREWSPKMHKFENNYTYGMFNKRNVEQFKEKENEGKVQIQSSHQTEMFNRIFSQLDRLSVAANLSDQNDSFKSLMKGLSTSIDEKQQLSIKITSLQAQLAKQSERCASLSEANKTVLRESNKFSTELHQIIKENAYIKQKYRQIEEQFEVLVKEKLQIETELEKKERQMLSKEKELQEQYQKKIMCLSLERKEEEESERHDLEMIISTMENTIKELMEQIQQRKRSKQRIILTTRVVGYHWEGSSNSLHQKKQLQISKYEYVRIECPTMTQSSIQTNPELDKLQIINTLCINIHPQQNMDKDIGDQIQAPLATFSLAKEICTQTDDCILRNQSTLTDLVINSSLSSQTDNASRHMESQTQLQCQESQQQTEIVISHIEDEETQTQKQPFIIQHNVNYKCDLKILKVNEQMNTNPPKLAYCPRLYNYQSEIVQKIFVSQIVQTDFDYDEQGSEQEQEIEYLPQDAEKQSSPTIVSMLLEAQQCLIVPQIVFLKEQILRYRQQIDKMKRQAKLECKQREDQNVFQFSL